MIRIHKRSLRGERLVAKVPHGRWPAPTFIAALRHDRITTCAVFNQQINSETFQAYVERALFNLAIPRCTRETSNEENELPCAD